MPFFIILIFYSYKAILGKNFLVLDILTFIVAVILGQLISYKIMFWENIPGFYNKIGIVLLFILFFAMIIVSLKDVHPLFETIYFKSKRGDGPI